jgi:NAD+ synthase
MTVDVLTAEALRLNWAAETDRIISRLRQIVGSQLRRRGVVVALSGGVDSSVCAALAARAFGPSRVLALLLPEAESSAASESLGRQVAQQLGVPYLLQDIGPVLEAIGCYRQRDDAIRRVVPAYGREWKSKIVISRPPAGKFSYFRLVVESPDGSRIDERLPAPEYLAIVAATSFKQRIRKTVEYFHADRLHYAVLGTPNRLEYDQGFFVKNGDGAADVKPIAHLYKTQVYGLAEYLGLPEPVRLARPTTDTYTLPQGQDEFYFALPYDKMDLALWARNHAVPVATLARALDMTLADAQAILNDIDSKRRATSYLHCNSLLIDRVCEVDTPS